MFVSGLSCEEGSIENLLACGRGLGDLSHPMSGQEWVDALNLTQNIAITRQLTCLARRRTISGRQADHSGGNEVQIAN